MMKSTEWLDNAVFYEIYPQSFKDTDGDGIGNINGITEKLDYIRELGCTALWLNPCYDSPFLDAGYDVRDYKRVAPRYGTNEDLIRLFEEAHARGMHVILDLVPGHTSWDHPWFLESMKAKKNEYTDRYIWTNSVWESTEDHPCLRGISERDGSCMVNFFIHQPALNYGFYKPDKPWKQAMDAPGPMASREAIKDVMRFWLSRGCDGFRVDMAGAMVKEDEDQKGTIDLWKDFRAFLDREFPEAAMISEWGEPKRSLEGGFHMDFLLHFGESHYNDLFRCEKPYFGGEGDASAFVAKYMDSYTSSGGKGLICIPSGNHDMDRLARHLPKDERKIAFAFLLSMPGAPYIYYGDEIGMRYIEGIPSVEGGYERTGARSPMQWDSGVNSGFSTAPSEKLYIPMDVSGDRPTAEKEMQDKDSLWNEISRLIKVRMEHKALQSLGKIEFISDGAPGQALAYVRSSENERIAVILNPTDHETEVMLPVSQVKEIYRFGKGAVCDGTITRIAAKSAVYLKIE